MIHQPDQRWRERQSTMLPPGSGRLDPAEYGVDLLDHAAAKQFIVTHHYAGTFPAARLSVGLWRKQGVDCLRLVGVAVFSVPAQAAAIPAHTGLPAREGVELGRFVLLDDVPYNGESWFLRRAFGVLAQAKPEVRAVLSYSDPLERATSSGILVKPGHIGTIYQASNALYLGRSKPDTIVIDGAGRSIPRRALSKIRNREQGADYAYARLVQAGAPTRDAGEDWPCWLTRALASPAFRRLRHPGNHTYAFGLDRESRLALAQRHPLRQPYPKQRREP